MSTIRYISACFFFVCFLILGIGGVWTYLASDPIAENELTLLEGIPRDVSIVEGRRIQVLHFSVAGQPMEYSNHDPNFAEVKSIISDGDSLRVSGAMRITLFGQQTDYFEIYKISVGDNAILSYADTVSYNAGRARASLIVGCFILAISLFVICGGFYELLKKKFGGPPSPEPAAGPYFANLPDLSGARDELLALQSGPFVFPSQERKRMRDEARRQMHAAWLRRGFGVLVIGMGGVLGEMVLGIADGQPAAALLNCAQTTGFLGLIVGPLVIYLFYFMNLLGLRFWPWSFLRILIYACPAFFAGMDFTAGEWSWLKAGSVAVGSIMAAFSLSIFGGEIDGPSSFE